MKKRFLIISLLTVLGLSTLVAVDLKITEIYFAGTDERIEISNMDSLPFSGDIQLSGAKSSMINLSDIFIPPAKSVLFGDSLGIVIGQSFILKSGLSLNISDTADLSISLFSSGQQIDTVFFAAENLVDLKTQKASIQKIQSGSNFILTGGNISSGRNVIPGFLANPGKLYSRQEIFNNSGSSSTNTGEIFNSGTRYFAPRLTEVYFDGYDERFEITNIGNLPFSGDLQVLGINSNPIQISNIYLSSGQSVIFSQKEYFFLDTGSVFLSGLSLTLQDESAITMSLVYSGQIIDTFQVSDYFVQLYNDQKTSFEKVGFETGLITTISEPERNFNIISGYNGNPGKFNFVASAVINVSTGFSTGSTNAGNIFSGSCDSFQTQIRISEIFPGDSNYPAFIELHSIQDFQGTIFLSGSALQSGLFFDINLPADKFVVLSPDSNSWIAYTNSLQNTALQLEFQGSEVGLYGQSGQVLDKAILSNLQTGISYYPSSVSDCEQNFDYNERFSPGFDEAILHYYPETQPQIVYIETGSTSCDSSGGAGGTTTIVYGCPFDTGDFFSGAICSGDLIFPDSDPEYDSGSNQTGDNILNSGSSVVQIKILDINYDPEGSDVDRETVLLQSFLPYDLNLENLRLHSLNRTTKNRIYGILSAGQTQIFTGNYRFPNSANCVNLLSGDIVLDQFCYDPNAQSSTGDDNSQTNGTGDTVGVGQTGQIIDTGRQLVFRIENIVFNPDGSDTNREQIVIKLLSGSTTSMEDFSLNVNDRKTKLFYPELNSTPRINSGETKIFTGNFRFSNSSPTCVSLTKDDWIYNTVCYDPTALTDENSNSDESRKNYIIKIKKIIYDPPGSDKDNETISLQMLSGETIDLSKFRLGVGTSTRRIYGELKPDELQTFKDNFRFPNSDPTCVSLFRDDIVFDSLCYDPTENTPTETGIQITDYADYEIKIKHIEYDPEGADKDRETITLFYPKGSGDLNLADNFYLQRGTTRRSLKNYGMILLNSSQILTGNFGFPNSKDSCVELIREDLVFDKYCYVIENSEKEDEKIDTEEITDSFLPNIQITSILPNPIGKDSDFETISLLYKKSNSSDPNEIILDKTYYLLIGTRKKYFSTGFLIPDQEQTFKGNFAFPNKASCVELRKGDSQLDSFCYTNPAEGEKFFENNGILNSLSTLDLSILNSVKIKKVSDAYCLTYEDQSFLCKKLPKTSSRTSLEKLYSAYLSDFYSYFNSNRSVVANQTALRYYKNMLTEAKKLLQDGQETVNIYGKEISIYDFESRFFYAHEKSSADYLIQNSAISILGQKLVSSYMQIKKTYFKNLYTKGNSAKF